MHDTLIGFQLGDFAMYPSHHAHPFYHVDGPQLRNERRGRPLVSSLLRLSATSTGNF